MKFLKLIKEWDEYGEGSKPIFATIAGIDLEFQHEGAYVFYFHKPGTFDENGGFSEEDKRILGEAFDNSIIVMDYRFPAPGTGIIEFDIKFDTLIELLKVTTEDLDL